MKVKYGEDWFKKIPEKDPGQFMRNLKQYGNKNDHLNQPIPFQVYKKDFSTLIEKGVNPIFEYPLMSFGETGLKIKDLDYRLLERLSPKFRKGFKRKKSAKSLKKE